MRKLSKFCFFFNASKTPTPRWISDDSQADQIYKFHRQPDLLLQHSSSADSLGGPGPHIAISLAPAPPHPPPPTKQGLSFISNLQRQREGTFVASELAGNKPTPPAPEEQGLPAPEEQGLPALARLGGGSKPKPPKIKFTPPPPSPPLSPPLLPKMVLRLLSRLLLNFIWHTTEWGSRQLAA